MIPDFEPDDSLVQSWQVEAERTHRGHPAWATLGEVRFPLRLAQTLTWAQGLRPDLAEVMRQQYVEWMPGMLLDSLVSAHSRRFFEARICQVETPRIYGLLEGVQGETFLEVYRQTCFGRLMPLLYGMPADFRAYEDEADGLGVSAVMDRRLSGPLAHELAHGSPSLPLSLPPYLDECVAGALGARRAPWVLAGEHGVDNGIFAALDFAHVGEWLIHHYGVTAVQEAQERASWSELLGSELFEALWRVASDDFAKNGQVHFLSDPSHSSPWLSLLAAGHAGVPLNNVVGLRDCEGLLAGLPHEPTPSDVGYLEFALRHGAVEHTLMGSVYRVASAARLQISLGSTGNVLLLGKRPARVWLPPGLRDTFSSLLPQPQVWDRSRVDQVVDELRHFAAGLGATH